MRCPCTVDPLLEELRQIKAETCGHILLELCSCYMAVGEVVRVITDRIEEECVVIDITAKQVDDCRSLTINEWGVFLSECFKCRRTEDAGRLQPTLEVISCRSLYDAEVC